MSCSCHGKSGLSVKIVSPYDQCTTCAKKHAVNAWTAFNEFTYTDDNRDYISGQLRAVVDHLMYEHKEIAILARDLAVIIEEARDSEIKSEWTDLLQRVRAAYYNDHPDVVERLNVLKETASKVEQIM